MNQGIVLVRHIAETYPTVTRMITELIQNALDENARNIEVYVKYRGSTRTVTVLDDGDGVTEEKIKTALQNVATPNRKRAGKFGQFSLGLMSPLGKGTSYSITSAEQNQSDKRLLRVTFDTEKILAQKDDIEVPFENCRTYVTRTKKQSDIWWTSEIVVRGITTDRRISTVDLENLKNQVITNFNQRIQEDNVRISLHSHYGSEKQKLTVEGQTWSGAPLTERPIEYETPGGDHVELRLYARGTYHKSFSKGVVLGVEGDPFRISAKDFCDSIELASNPLHTEVQEVLLSKLLEGEIFSSGLRLHPDRSRFYLDTHLEEFSRALEYWYFTDGGKEIFADLQKASVSKTYTETAREALKRVQKALAQDELRFLRDAISSFKWGNIGVGHKKPAISVPTDIRATAVDGFNTGTADTTSTKKKRSPQTEHLRHQPLTVVNEKGRKRDAVYNNSLGITMWHVNTLPESRLWDIDDQDGIIYINVRHPLWAVCEDHKKSLDKLTMLQQQVVIKALQVVSGDPSERISIKNVLDQDLSTWVRINTL